MTDNEIIKALECYRGQKLFAFNGKKPEIYIHDILDLIGRQKAEIERLNKQLVFEINSAFDRGRTEAYKEFYENLHTEILAARDSNFKAKEERIGKSKEYGIPIDIEDNFLMYCDGKIHALDGIDYYAYEIYKELEGENDETKII